MLVRSLLSALSAAALAAAQASTWTHSNDNAVDTVFAINAAKSNGDIWFHLETPANYEWIVVAPGTQMSNALMFIVYPAGTGDNITISPRQSYYHQMPKLNPDIDCSLVEGPLGNFRDGTRYSANVHCKNITKWSNSDGSTGVLDLTSTNMGFLIGTGPSTSNPPGGDDSVDIQQHPYPPRRIQVNMVQATSQTGPGQIPSLDQTSPNSTATNGTTVVGGDDNYDDYDPEWSTTIHGIFMIVAFVVLFPVGALCIRLWNRVRMHQGAQYLGFICVIIGMSIGIYAAVKYQKFGAHPIIGLVVVACVFIQLGLGITNHRIFKRTQRTTIMGTIHKFLGPLIILVGIGNAFYGFVYAGRPHHNGALVVLLVIMFGTSAIAIIMKRRSDRRAAGAPQPRPYPPPAGTAVPGYGAPQNFVPANNGFYAPPPGPPPSQQQQQQPHGSHPAPGQDSGITRPPLYQADSSWGQQSREDIHMVAVEPKSHV